MLSEGVSNMFFLFIESDENLELEQIYKLFSCDKLNETQNSFIASETENQLLSELSENSQDNKLCIIINFFFALNYHFHYS
jgi:hypothetical protein